MKNTGKFTPQPALKLYTYETIEIYPEGAIYVFADDSTVKVTINDGYGSIIYTSDTQPIELLGPCTLHDDIIIMTLRW